MVPWFYMNLTKYLRNHGFAIKIPCQHRSLQTQANYLLCVVSKEKLLPTANDILFWLSSSVLIYRVLDNSSLHKVRKQGLFIILIPHSPESKFRKYIPILRFPEIIYF